MLSVQRSKISYKLISGATTPTINVLLGGVNFSDLAFIIKESIDGAPVVNIKYGDFIQTLIDFTIIAFSIFMTVKAINKSKNQKRQLLKRHLLKKFYWQRSDIY